MKRDTRSTIPLKSSFLSFEKDVETILRALFVESYPHSDGLKSCYGSLDEDVAVNVGDSVSRGDELGSVSTSANAETDAGAHLHFAMFDNDKKVDPASYLNIQTK